MKIKTFILTFLLMSCPFLFGQNWTDPGNLGFYESMRVTADITLDGNVQQSSYQVAAFHENTLLDVSNIIAEVVNGNETYHVDMEVPGETTFGNIYFKFFNGTNEYVSLEVPFTDLFGTHANIETIQFKSVAQIGNVVYSTLQDAVNACTTGDNTITLLANVSDDVTIKQVANVNVVIDGKDKQYSGTFTIHGNSRYEGAETLRFTNINFVTSEASHYFIDSNSTESDKRYAHNVTVDKCTFTATNASAAVNSAAAMRIRQGFNIAINESKFNGLHSALQAYGNKGITVTDITLDGKNGISAGTSSDVTISGSTINATGYGVRADGDGAYDMTLADNTITADLPVVVRKTTGAYNLTVESGSYTTSNGNPAVTFTTGDDGTFVAPTTNATATITGNVTTFGFEAKVDNVYYTTLAKAFEAAQTGETIILTSDVTLAQTFKITKNIVLDLNGKTIAGTDNETKSFALIEIQPGKELTLEATNGGEITLTANNNRGWNAYSSVISNQRGKLVVNGGTIKHNGGTAMAYGIDNLTNGKNTYAETVVNNGTVQSPYRAIRQFLNGTEAQNILTVNGGTIKSTGGNKSIWMQDPSTSANSGTLTVSANASLYGDAYLDVTEGSTEWPVEISIAAAALKDGSTVVTENVPPKYSIQLTNGNYTKVALDAVAKIGETLYYSLDAAVKAATAGQTITLLKDVNESFTISKSVTIDGAGKKYTGTMTGNKGLTVTIQNVNFVNAGCEINSEKTTGNYTFEKCTFDGKGTYAYPIKVASANTIIVNECTVKDYLYSFLYIRTATLNVSVKNVTVENCPSYAVYFASGVNNGTIENLTVNNSNNGIVYNNTANRALTLNNCTFVNVTTAINHDKGTNTITCKLNGVNDFGGAALSQYVKIVAEAQIGNKFYDKLQDAIIAAEATEENETIKIAANFSTETTYKVNGNVTLDLNGNTITGSDTYTASFGLININPGANLTINDSSNGNGKITLVSTNNRAWNAYSSVISNQRGKLVVNGGTIEHLGGTDMAYAIDNLTNTGAQKAETVVNGGKVISTYRAIRQFANSTTGENILTINGGEVSYVWMQSANAYANLAATHVEGGTVEQIRISGNNAVLDLDVKASCLGENGVWGTMPTGKVLKEVEGYYTLVDAIAKIVAADNTTTYYASIQEAVNAATTDQVVTVCADVELANTLTIAAGKVVTLDLNGKVVSGVSATAGTTAVISNKGNLTVKSSVEGGKITTKALNPDTNWGGEGQPSFPSYANNTVRNEGTFTLVSGTIENTSAAGGATYAIDNYNGSTTNINGGLVYCENNIAIRLFCGDNIALNVKDGEVKGTRALWIQLASSNASVAPNVDVNIEGGILTATGNGEYKLAIYSYSYGNNMQNVEINIDGGTFNGDIALTGGSNRENVEKLNITGGTFNGKDGDVYSYGDDAKAIEAITITGGTFNSNYAEKYAENDNFIFVENAEGKYNVTEGAYVAAIGETRYSSVANAIAAAQAGKTITLLKDVNESFAISKSVTIDGAGKKYTGTMIGNAGLTVTIQNVNFVNAGFDKPKAQKSTTGQYTIKNCTFEGNGTYDYPIRAYGANIITVENCTVNNYEYSFLYIPSATLNVSVKNVTVTNCPNYAVYFASGVNNSTIEKLTVKNSNNGIIYNNTANRALTLKDCTFENVGTAIDHTGGTKNITCTLNGVNNFGNAASSDYAKYVLAAEGTTLTALKGLTVTTTVKDHSVKYLEGAYKLVPNVARIGDVTYASIQEAINAAQNGDEIVVLQNVTLDADDKNTLAGSYNTFLLVENKTITIDLNGHTIIGDVTGIGKTGSIGLVGIFSINGTGHLTLKDEVGSAVVKIENATDTDPVYALISCFDGQNGSELTINGGSYSLNAAQDALIHSAPSEKVVINNGNFFLGNVGSGTNGQPWIFNANGQNNRNVKVNGGTYNYDINHQYWAFEVNISETLALRNNGNGTWTVVPAEAYVVEQFQNFERNVGYATLEEAFAVAMAKDYTNVVLVDIVALENTITVNAGEEVVLDLNGKTISQEKECTTAYSMFTNNGKLTIKGEGTINFKDLSYGGGDSWATNVITNNGELIVENGTIEHLGTADNDFDTNLPIQNYAGKVTINGGTIKSTQFRSLRDFTAGGEIVINGGKFIGQVWMQGLGNGSSSLTINGGEFEPQANDGSSVFITNGTNVVNVSITGGTFATKIGATVPTKEGVAGCITGGTFTTTAKENTNAALVNENYSFVDNGNDTWTVKPTQKQHLVKGWNWYSSYLNIQGETGFEKLTTALGANASTIKSQDNGSTDYYDGSWYGGLEVISPSQMYKINASEACELNISESVVNPEEHIIKLKAAGWSWIGYPSNVGVDINVAFANLQPADGDVIKTQNNGSADYAFGQWWGSLNTMVPGIGYQYRNAAGEVREFTYKIEVTRAATKANVTSDNNHWVPNGTLYPNTMTMTVVVEGAIDENYEIAAFVNGEVRGSARPIYVEPMDAYMFFLTIHGDEVEAMTFKCYDLTTGEEFELSNRINYSNDAHLGSVKDPYTLTRGTLGLEEVSSFNIYPNPTTTDREINLSTTCKKVEVFNALGVKVAEYQNVDTLDAFET
ncbi:MAG: right-handed parallel beta-helix repeat-containing protein, partial [Bacteroidales bacterium]|nr:right-handed parallel beta-helix repeat-containing protein [Bacteroidales bacterium]